MNKNQFMAELGGKLSSLPAEERDAALRYYEEYFIDAGPENEQSAIDQLGSPKEVADAILAEFKSSAQPYYTSPYGESADSGRPGTENPSGAGKPSGAGNQNGTENQSFTQSRWRGVPIWLLLIGAVFAFPFLAGLFGVAVGAVAAVFGLLISLIAVMASLLIAGIAIIVAGFLAMMHSPAIGFLLLGFGLVLSGLGILLLHAGILLIKKVVPGLIQWFVELCKKLFRKRGAVL
ncbi:MAG TPA: hypothetical protein DEQ02_05315 [Ruminococcaceae bacterium]|nr:hypothetical protein [Oscillospiraceae bacterium]